jgi:type II secretory pathway pseudopilin PulG
MAYLSRSFKMRSRGFTYIWLLIAVAITSAGLAATSTLYSASVARSKQIELQWVLQQYQIALKNYAAATPIGQAAQPIELYELIDDKRYVTIRRHIRELYSNPVTGQNDWILLRQPNGRILGVQN